MGPIQLIPHHGSGWATQKRPERLRATYSKPNGVRYLFGAYDVHADRLHGRLRGHKNAGEVLAFYQQIRMRYDPRLRLYLIADNLSTHKTPAIREWAETANTELIDPDLCQLPQPHRMPLLGHRRVRHQQRRLPQPGKPRQSDGRPHPLPQRPPPRPTPDRRRAQAPHRRLTHAVPGQTFPADPRDHLDDLPAPQAAALGGALALIEQTSTDRFAIYAGVLSLLAALAEGGPILVVIDDVQWIDAPSAEAVFFAARRLGAERIGVLIAGRDDVRFDVPPGMPRVLLGGLSAAAGRALLAREPRSVAPAVRDRLLEAMRGNPLALTEITATLDDDQLTGARPLDDRFRPGRRSNARCCAASRRCPIRPVGRSSSRPPATRTPSSAFSAGSGPWVSSLVSRAG